MKKLQEIAKALASLSKQVEKLSKQIGKGQAKAKSPKKAVVRKAAVKKAPAARKAVKKAAVKKAAPKKAAPPKKVKTPARKPTVLEKVLAVIQKSKNGANIATLKAKTNLDPKQLSNALYKLSKRGLIGTTSRGVYVKK